MCSSLTKALNVCAVKLFDGKIFISLVLMHQKKFSFHIELPELSFKTH